MSNKEHLKEVLDYLQTTEGKTLKLDEEAIASAYHKNNDDRSLPVKVLSVLGGVLASLAFLGFLFIAGLYHSGTGLLVLGIICITASVWISRAYDNIIMDTLSVSAFIIGFMLLGFGLDQLKINENSISVIFMIIALSSIYIVRNYILSFVAVLIINGSMLTLMISNQGYDLILIYVALLALIMTCLFLKEARIITMSKSLSKLYDPVRTGLICSFLSVLAFLGIKGVLPVSPHYIWLSSLIIISVIVYLHSTLFGVWSITGIRHKAAVYIFTVLALLPTVFSPAISGAVLLMLLSFSVNYRTGLVLGIISFIYFIAQYYYDLHFTLLTKSILLLSTGVLFMAIYWFLYKKWTTNEKI